MDKDKTPRGRQVMGKIFKAKRLDNSEWVELTIVQLAHGDYHLTDKNDNWNYNGLRLDVDTLSQYTGLNDSEGKKIFFGDEVEVKAFPDSPSYESQVRFGRGRYYLIVKDKARDLNIWDLIKLTGRNIYDKDLG